jgi:fatty-acyl-CoA synthase
LVRICRDIEATQTFKPKKQLLAREGFDPREISDPLYVDDAARGTYVSLSIEQLKAMGNRSRF